MNRNLVEWLMLGSGSNVEHLVFSFLLHPFPCALSILVMKKDLHSA